MTWFTIRQCRDFLRGATAYPEYGLVKTGVGLPDETPRWRQREDMRTLADYEIADVAGSFSDFTNFIRNSGWRIHNILNHDYTDNEGRSREVSQLGGHYDGSGFFPAIHLTQRSDTLGDDPNQYHHFVMESQWDSAGNPCATMFVARNLAFTAMAGAYFSGPAPHLSTAATGFATTQNDLINGLNELLSARNLPAHLQLPQLPPSATLLDISAALYLVNYGDKPYWTRWVGDRAISGGDKGKAEVADLNLPNSQFLAAVLNNVSDIGWDLFDIKFLRPGIVPMDQKLAQRFVAQQGWTHGPAILDKMASDGLDLHAQVYGALTRVVAEGTGMGR